MGVFISMKKSETMARVYEEAKQRRGTHVPVIPFNNTMVEYHAGQLDFKNKFDAPKIDFRSQLPENMKKDHAFILPLGKTAPPTPMDPVYNKKVSGDYLFIQGTPERDGFLDLPKFTQGDFVSFDPGAYDMFKSDVSWLGISEAMSISTLVAYGMVSDFFFDSASKPCLIHDSRRARFSGTIYIHTREKPWPVTTRSVQLEVDALWEWEDLIVPVEGKAYRYDELRHISGEATISWRQLAYLSEYSKIELAPISSKPIRYALAGQVKKHKFGKRRVFFIIEFEPRIVDGGLDIIFTKKKGYVLQPGW